MRLFKLIVFLLVVGILALFIYQNMATFTVSHDFILDFKVRAPIKWSLQVYEILLISMGIGLFIGLLLLIKPWLNAKRALSRERKEKETLREKLESYQGFPKSAEEKKETGKEEDKVIVTPPPQEKESKEGSQADEAAAESGASDGKAEEAAGESGTVDVEEKSKESSTDT